jgi:hypothetical protein
MLILPLWQGFVLAAATLGGCGRFDNPNPGQNKGKGILCGCGEMMDLEILSLLKKSSEF